MTASMENTSDDNKQMNQPPCLREGEIKAGFCFWSNCSLTEVLPDSRQIKNLPPDPLNPFNKSKSFNLTSLNVRVLNRTKKVSDAVSSAGKNHIKDIQSPKNNKREY